MSQLMLYPRRPAHSAVVVVLLLVVASCAKESDGAATAEVSAVVGARTELVVEGDFTETVGAIGVVEPRIGHRAVLSAPIATRVTAVAVSAGERVVRGQVLVEFEKLTIDADARSAEAAALAAQQAFDRAERMVTYGIAARREQEQAAAALAQAKAALATARRTADLTSLRAPISGVVTQMNATLGASVDPSQALVEIADPSVVDVVLALSAHDAARVHVGAKVMLHAGSASGGEVLGEATVVDIAGVVDAQTHSVAVRARAGQTSRGLRIGETFYANVVLAVRPHALMVPAEALVPEGDGYKVFVVDASGMAVARDVTVGGRHDGTVEVTRGLTAGERVVTYGAYGVTDSATIVLPGTKPVADSAKGGA
ncbi:MAG: efflux RND transporter periplasmic adaptor subunit [Gemmatimonadetes bacterium]|nr:efflux RND transporter periplasmic adaptor subunit [Gemmatimonadota bacterium]